METLKKTYRLDRLLIAAIILLLSANAFPEVHATLAVMSEYLGKGYSKSNGDFSYLINLDYQHLSGFYTGSNVAYVNFGDSGYADAARVEITPYVGWTINLSEGWRLDSQWSRYIYDGKIFGHRSDYNEFYFFLHFRDILSASASFSEDYYQGGHAAGNYEITGRYPITDFLEISATTGYTQAKQVLEYDFLYWNAGLTLFYKFISLDFRYVDAQDTARIPISTDDSDVGYYPEILNPTFLFSISVGF